MLELMLTRPDERRHGWSEPREGLRFLVLDELHTYRGRQGADVAMLVRRLRDAVRSDRICSVVGTTATMVERAARSRDQQREVWRESPPACSAPRSRRSGHRRDPGPGHRRGEPRRRDRP